MAGIKLFARSRLLNTETNFSTRNIFSANPSASVHTDTSPCTRSPRHPLVMALLMSAKLPFKCTGSLSPKEHTGRLVPRARGEEETSSLPPSLHHGAGWPGSHPEQAGSLRAKPTLSGEAGNNHPGPHRPLSLEHKPAFDWSEPQAHLCSTPGGAGASPSKGRPSWWHSTRWKHDSGQERPRATLPFPSEGRSGVPCKAVWDKIP